MLDDDDNHLDAGYGPVWHVELLEHNYYSLKSYYTVVGETDDKALDTVRECVARDLLNHFDIKFIMRAIHNIDEWTCQKTTCRYCPGCPETELDFSFIKYFGHWW